MGTAIYLLSSFNTYLPSVHVHLHSSTCTCPNVVLLAPTWWNLVDLGPKQKLLFPEYQMKQLIGETGIWLSCLEKSSSKRKNKSTAMLREKHHTGMLIECWYKFNYLQGWFLHNYWIIIIKLWGIFLECEQYPFEWTWLNSVIQTLYNLANITIT